MVASVPLIVKRTHSALGIRLRDLLGPGHLELVAGAVVGALVDLLGHGRGHGGIVVAQNQRAVAHPVVDQLVAVDVPLARAVGAFDVDRKGREVAAVVRDATRDRLARALEQLS